MMRVIVFDRELHEPLTVLEVPNWLAENAKGGQRIMFAPPHKAITSYEFVTGIPDLEMETCSFTFEAVYRTDRRKGPEILFWYAYADNPTLTLRLRAAFLPGQVGEVRRLEDQAWIKGLLMQPVR